MTDSTLPGQLQLSFDPMTIEHLGSNMYSQLPNAVAELVANSFDADARTIVVRVSGRGAAQTIAVEDDGHGMSRDDLSEKYLRIGRNRRNTVGEFSESGNRKVSGKKGLGKLALFGIGSVVEVESKRAGSLSGTRIVMDWDELRSSGSSVYAPAESTFNAAIDRHGTNVTIRNLERKTDINAKALAASLSRLFNYSDSGLAVSVVGVDGAVHPVDARTRLATIDAEFRWEIPDDSVIQSDALRAMGIFGQVVAARTPLQTHLRGVTVYANGRMVNEPEFFGASDSSYAYAYLTGYVTIDALDEIRPDVIATDRRAVNWDTPGSAPFRDALRRMVEQIAQDRRRQREAAKLKRASDRIGLPADSWHETIKGAKASRGVEDVMRIVASDDADLPDQVVEQLVTSLKDVAPPYADMFWRQLDAAVQSAAEAAYKDGRYLEAVIEAYKAFISLTRELCDDWTSDESSLIGKAYGRHVDAKLKILRNFDTSVLAQPTIDSAEDGQRDLVKGVGAAFRNPASHVPLTTIEAIGLFSYQDCLDALSVISHLCRRARGSV